MVMNENRGKEFDFSPSNLKEVGIKAIADIKLAGNIANHRELVTNVDGPNDVVIPDRTASQTSKKPEQARRHPGNYLQS